MAKSPSLNVYLGISMVVCFTGLLGILGALLTHSSMVYPALLCTIVYFLLAVACDTLKKQNRFLALVCILLFVILWRLGGEFFAIVFYAVIMLGPLQDYYAERNRRQQEIS